VARSSDRDANWELKDRFAQVYDQYSRLRNGMNGLQARLAALQVTEKSANGLVKVTVNARGQLMNVELHPSCFREYSAHALGEEITKIVAKATAAAGQGVSEMMAEFMPQDSAALKLIQTGDISAAMSRQDDVMNYRPEA
jgi:DNA-binding protein YbaB